MTKQKAAAVQTVKVKSTLDGSQEEVLFIPGKRGAPLLVSLHSWSVHKENELGNIREMHARTGWSILAPEFRGPNLKENPRASEACASELAKQDILDAVKTVIRRFKIKPSRVFLTGGSGGAHMALMMAGYAPKRWTAVCAWCPATDFRDKGIWANFTHVGRRPVDFRAHLKACCGKGIVSRAPVGHIDSIAQATVYIFHGNKDIALPFRTQSLAFYNQLIERHPEAECYLTIFNGGHESRLDDTLRIFERYLPEG